MQGKVKGLKKGAKGSNKNPSNHERKNIPKVKKTITKHEVKTTKVINKKIEAIMVERMKKNKEKLHLVK